MLSIAGQYSIAESLLRQPVRHLRRALGGIVTGSRAVLIRPN